MLKQIQLPKFTARPAYSLIFITEVKSFRVDADHKGVLASQVETIEHGCKTTANLGKTFSKIAENTAPLGRKVWILFLRLPNLLINVPSIQVQGIDAQQLAQALQFEAEGMTGLSSREMRVAFHLLQADNDMSDYWLIQIEQLAWNDLLEAMKQRKCQLAGLLHPGALPAALHHNEAQDWLRLEAWSNQIVAIHRHESRMNLQCLSFDLAHWQTELEQWLQDQQPLPVSETLLNNRREMLPSTEHYFSLNENTQLHEWLSLWARSLIAEKAKEAAVLQPVADFNVDLAWMIGSGVTACLLCGTHALWHLHQRHYYEAETQHLTQIEKTITDLRKQVSDVGQQKSDLENKVNKIAADAAVIPVAISKLQQRPADLLRSLAEGRHPDLIVETIDSQAHEVVISGISLQQHLSNELADYLNQQLQACYWRIESPSKENLSLFDSSAGPWEFKLRLRDQGVTGLTHAATTNPGRKP